jgi:hypothetical protein
VLRAQWRPSTCVRIIFKSVRTTWNIVIDGVFNNGHTGWRFSDAVWSNISMFVSRAVRSRLKNINSSGYSSESDGGDFQRNGVYNVLACVQVFWNVIITYGRRWPSVVVYLCKFTEQGYSIRNQPLRSKYYCVRVEISTT